MHIIRPGQTIGLYGFPFYTGDLLYTFTSPRDFDAMIAAERWIAERGFAVGRNQGPDPRGIRYGLAWDIQKWRNLTRVDRADLDGVMLAPTGQSMRRGPITVRLRAEAPIALVATPPEGMELPGIRNAT